MLRVLASRYGRFVGSVGSVRAAGPAPPVRPVGTARPARSAAAGYRDLQRRAWPSWRCAVVREAAPTAYGEATRAFDEAPALDAVLALNAAPALDEDDAIEALGDEIATLAAHIHAATYRMLVLIADFDGRRGWERDGHRSCAHWLAFRTGIDLGAAREKVRTARVLVDLPATGACMERGELSFSQVRALTRIATPENEENLLELARGCTTAQLERIIRSWRPGSRKDEATRERERHETRTFSVFPDDDGMYRVKGRLEPEVAAVLMRAIEAAGDALYRRNRADAAFAQACAALCSEDETRKAAAQRRADALGLLAERALAAGFGRTGGGGATEVAAEVAASQGKTSVGKTSEVTATEGESADTAPISGTRAERFQVVLHVEKATISEAATPVESEGGWPAGGSDGPDSSRLPVGHVGPGPRSHLDDGTRVAAETSRRLSCDASRVQVTHAPDGSVLDVGRKTRTIPPALRRALDARDRGCRFPGCGLHFTDAHHVKHWADGGETKLGNTLLVCRVHHGLLHEGGWRVVWWGAGRAVFIDPRGGEHFDGGWTAPGSGSVDVLVEANRRRGVEPDWRTAGARWKRIEDVPDEVWFRAMEGAG